MKAMQTRNTGGASIRRRVAVAVLAIDDFTAKPITTSDLRITADQSTALPIRKKDGYFLFMDEGQDRLTIRAEGFRYNGAAAEVQPALLPPLRPVVKLRLMPNRNYVIPSQTTCLEGQAAPHTTVRVVVENHPRPIRLLYPYEKKKGQKNDVLQLFCTDYEDLEGRQLVLMQKDSREPVFFRPAARVSEVEGGYRLEQPLPKEYKKAGVTILPVYQVQADEQGRFFLPMHSLSLKHYECSILWSEDQIRWEQKKEQIAPARVTKLVLS